jgi:hypothetical protein
VTAVGHRALVAYERADGRYDVHYSHWGAHDWSLATLITENFPYGRPVEAADGPPPIDPASLSTDCTLDDVVEAHVDFHSYEALFVVSEAFDIRPFMVCWFGVPGAADDRTDCGAAVAIAADDVETDGAYVRGWFDGTKGAVLDAVDRNRLDPGEATRYLADRLETWASDGRAVHLGPGVESPAESDHRHR